MKYIKKGCFGPLCREHENKYGPKYSDDSEVNYKVNTFYFHSEAERNRVTVIHVEIELVRNTCWSSEHLARKFGVSE